jgi:diacylglycerol kinase family enzyme
VRAVRVRLLVNPVASSMTARRRIWIENRIGERHVVEVVCTEGHGHARALGAGAAADGVDVVVVAAGDGTLNEAADGLLGTATALAPLPGGSTNVFARAVGYGHRLDRATERLLEALERGSTRRIGVGAANARTFLFHLGAGFDAAVVDRVERHPEVKRFAAHPAFAYHAARLLARGFDRRSPPIVVRGAGDQEHESFLTVVSNLAPYTYAGPRRMVLTEDASLDRALAVTSFTRFDLVDVVTATASALGRSVHLQHAEHVVQLHDVSAITLAARDPARPIPWQVDGEILGVATAVDVRYVPDALSVVFPG